MIENQSIYSGKERHAGLSFISDISTQFLELLFPPVCSFCGKKLFHEEPFEGVCRVCLAQIPFRPNEKSRINCIEEDTENWKERKIQMNIEVMAVCNYETMIRKSLIAMKFYEAAYMKHFFGSLFYFMLNKQKEQFDGIIPVPLHHVRFLERGYNQAGLIAGKISELAGIPLLENCLIRIKNTKRQSEMSRYSDRLENVANAFCCIAPEKIPGKKILLIDDILTSGETMISAARAIWNAVDKHQDKNKKNTNDIQIIGGVLASSRK